MLFWKAFRQHAAGADTDTRLDERVPVPFPDDPTAYDAFQRNDSVLKAWLPEALWLALDEVAVVEDLSRAALVRATLFRYVYGELDYARMLDTGKGWFSPKEPAPKQDSEATAPKFSRKSCEMPELGKSTSELRLELPTRLRDDLQVQATAAGEPLSSHIRRILAIRAFGTHYLSQHLS